MSKIQQLPPGVVNKIAAGEVIERPASVVKELMENALDAGANRVEVSVEQGGLELIRVVDDGCGIPPGELRLAVASHATSKLESADDLFRVRTLGFRGEALASIAEISQFLLRSRAEGLDGAEITVTAGTIGEVTPCGCPGGTAVEVRRLFMNTPVRRKFLRSTQTEFGHVSETFTRLALAFPRVHFILRHNNRVMHDLPPCAEWLERIETFFGRELASSLLWVESEDGEYRLTGYVALPSQSRANAKMQYLFLNRRSIRDRSLQHALSEAYRGLLLTGRHPISFLCFEMPPDAVDVNVHPTKLEVRFQDSGRLYSQLLGTLRTKFLRTDLTHRVSPADEGSSVEGAEASGHDAATAERIRNEFVDWARGKMAAWESPSPGVTAPETGRQSGIEWPATPHAPLELNPISRPYGSGAAPVEPFEEREQLAPSITLSAARSALGLFSAAPQALQIHDRYLVTESEEGVVVIDQHALHERILYEQLREKVLGGGLEVQSLLAPEPVELSSGECALAMEHREVLRELGLNIEDFGGATLLVTSYPAMLRQVNAGELLRDILTHLSEGRKPDRRDLLDSLLHMISCKAAVKAGDRLAPDEIANLLAHRALVQDTHHCPHGRPTALVFTREQLDRQFMRT